MIKYRTKLIGAERRKYIYKEVSYNFLLNWFKKKIKGFTFRFAFYKMRSKFTIRLELSKGWK